MNPMNSLFGNTVIAISMRGSARWYYDPDGTVTGVDETGRPLAGTWTSDGIRLCTTIVQPEPRSPRYSILQSRKVGDRWKVHRVDGTTTILKLEAGR